MTDYLSPTQPSPLLVVRQKLLTDIYGPTRALPREMPIVWANYTTPVATLRYYHSSVCSRVDVLRGMLDGGAHYTVHRCYPNTWNGKEEIVSVSGYGSSHYLVAAPYLQLDMTLALINAGYICNFISHWQTGYNLYNHDVPGTGARPQLVTLTDNTRVETTSDMTTIQADGIHPQRLFLGPVFQVVNYAASLGRKSVCIGFSRGGLTVEWAAALDPRIVRCFSACGAIPKRVRSISPGANDNWDAAAVRSWEVLSGPSSNIYGAGCREPGRRMVKYNIRQDTNSTLTEAVLTELDIEQTTVRAAVGDANFEYVIDQDYAVPNTTSHAMSPYIRSHIMSELASM